MTTPDTIMKMMIDQRGIDEGTYGVIKMRIAMQIQSKKK